MADHDLSAPEKRLKDKKKAWAERLEEKKNRPERKKQEKANRKKAGRDLGDGLVEGHYSKRSFDPDKAGGFILDLSWEDAEITEEGIELVKKHLSRFEDDEWNMRMIERLEKIEKGKIPITDFDKRFYTHETREFERYKTLGHENTTWKDVTEDEFHEIWGNTHAATLEDYKIFEKIEYKGKSIYSLYHPEVQF